MRALPFFFAGALFAVGLAYGGMTNPARITGFLDLFGTWDPTLLFVMAGALGTFVVGNALVRRRAAPLLGGEFCPRDAAGPDARLVWGSALFGVGWGLAGFCPGPAMASLGWPREHALWFVPAMLVGMAVAQRAFGADPPQ